MSQAQDIATTALQTAVALAPTLVAADPKVAAITAAATLGLNLLQAATAAQQAGMIPADQLSALFLAVGQGIQSTHLQWAAMNAADAAKAGAQ